MFALLRDLKTPFADDDQSVHLVTGAGSFQYLGSVDGALPSWLDLEVVDLGGRVAIPALVDCHVHVTGGGGEAGFGSRIAPPPASAYRAGGVGSLVGVLGTDDLTRTPQSLVAWTRELAAQHLNAWCHSGGYHLPPATITGSAKGDIVWIDRMIGIGEVAICDHRSSQPTPQALRELAAEAHVAGLMTGKAGILHLHVGDGEAGLEPIRAAMHGSELPPRVFNPTHLNRRKALLDEAIDLAKQGCTVDFTAFPVEEGEDAYTASEALRLYLERGGPPDRVTISSDAGGCLPVFGDDGSVERFDVARADAMLNCLKQCLRSGLSLAEALPAFTTNPARLLRLNAGELTVGSRADLLVLEGDPTSGDLESGDFELCCAMYGGRWFDRNGEAATANRIQEELQSD